MIKGIITCVLGLYGFILFLTKYILSYSYSSDEWGQYYDLNRDFALLFFGFAIVICLGVYYIYADVKKITVVGFDGILIGLIGVCGTLYTLGLGIKYTYKGYDPTSYFLIMPFFVVIFSYGLYLFLAEKKGSIKP